MAKAPVGWVDNVLSKEEGTHGGGRSQHEMKNLRVENTTTTASEGCSAAAVAGGGREIEDRQSTIDNRKKKSTRRSKVGDRGEWNRFWSTKRVERKPKNSIQSSTRYSTNPIAIRLFFSSPLFLLLTLINNTGNIPNVKRRSNPPPPNNIIVKEGGFEVGRGGERLSSSKTRDSPPTTTTTKNKS